MCAQKLTDSQCDLAQEAEEQKKLLSRHIKMHTLDQLLCLATKWSVSIHGHIFGMQWIIVIALITSASFVDVANAASHKCQCC